MTTQTTTIITEARGTLAHWAERLRAAGFVEQPFRPLALRTTALRTFGDIRSIPVVIDGVGEIGEFTRTPETAGYQPSCELNEEWGWLGISGCDGNATETRKAVADRAQAGISVADLEAAADYCEGRVFLAQRYPSEAAHYRGQVERVIAVTGARS